MSLIGFFDRGMSLGPERVAYVQGDESWTFQRGYDVTCRVSNALLAEGLAAETRCAVLAGNSPLAWLCVLGVWRAGLAWVPLNRRSPPADHVQVIGGFDVEALFFQKAFAPAIEMIRAQCPRLRVLVCLDGESPVAQSFEDFCARFPTEAPDLFPAEDSLGAIMPTGGTTGRPKGVMLTQRSLGLSVAQHHQHALRGG